MTPELTFGDRLRGLRKSRKLSQADVAKKTGFLQSAVSHFEVGRRLPTLENLIRLADAFDVSADFLLGRTADSSPPKLTTRWTPLPMLSVIALILAT